MWNLVNYTCMVCCAESALPSRTLWNTRIIINRSSRYSIRMVFFQTKYTRLLTYISYCLQSDMHFLLVKSIRLAGTRILVKFVCLLLNSTSAHQHYLSHKYQEKVEHMIWSRFVDKYNSVWRNAEWPASRHISTKSYQWQWKWGCSLMLCPGRILVKISSLVCDSWRQQVTSIVRF